MPPKKGTKGKGKQAEEKVEKKDKTEPTPPPAPPREPTPAPPPALVPEPEPEPLPVPVPVSITVQTHVANDEQHNLGDDVNPSGHDQSERQGEDNGWGGGGGWDNAGGGGDGGGSGWGGGNGWEESGGTGGSEFDEFDDGKDAGYSDGAWEGSQNPSAPTQQWPSPSQPGVAPPSAPDPVPQRPQPPAHPQPSQLHDQSAAQHRAAPPQDHNPPPVAQKVYTSASAMANRGAHPAPARAEEHVPDRRAPNRPSYYWAPNQAAQTRQAMPSATSAPQKAPMPPVSAWGEPKNVDPWGAPKPQPQPPPAAVPAPAKAQPRQAWQDWGRQSQPAAAKAPPARKHSTPSAWASTYDDDEYTEDDDSDETYGAQDPWQRPARGPSGWGHDPRKQPKNQPGYPQRGHPAQKAQSSPHHHQQQRQQAEQQRQQQQHKQQMPQYAQHQGVSQDGSKKPKKQHRKKGGGWEDDGWGTGADDRGAGGDGWEGGGGEGGGRGGGGWGGGGWGGGGGGEGGGGGGDYDGWHDGGGDGWDKLAQGNDKGWEQNDGWESHENSWSNNAKGSTNNWGAKDEWSTNKDAWATADDAWGNNDGGDEDDGWGEEEDDWEESHRYHQVSPSEGISKQEHVWGGSQTESHYFMPSKTLAHALNGTQLKPTNGVPPNKMDEYTNVKFLESRNAAFAPVQRAIFGRERKARDRVHWMFSPDKDDRVSAILAWIQAMEYNLGSFGLHKFLQTRERGALFVNVTFRHQERQNQPVFDWLTFDEIQSSADRTLQESVLSYDPAMQVVIFVYLPSKSGNSVAMWRRKVLVPNNTRLRFQQEIAIAKGGLRRDKDYVVHVDELPPKNKGKAAPKPALTKAAAKQAAKQAAKEAKQAKQVPAKSALVKHQRVQSLPVIPEKKKRKWWQILRFED